MNLFLDTNENSLYVTTKRNGSTLMTEISTVAPNLQSINLETFADLLVTDKNIKIYAPVRDPIVRFKSGLAVNLYNRSGHLNVIDNTTLNLYKHMLMYFDNGIIEPGKLLTVYPNRPFHLYDSHCDHWLGTLMLLPCLGSNLVVIPMNKFSEHLKHKFSEGTEFISNRERPDSFNNTKPDYEKLWEVYKKVFVDVKLENTLSYEQWMEPEIKIFKILTAYKDDMLKIKSELLFNDLLDRKLYFNDLYSPNTHTMFTIINELSSRGLTTEKLDNFLAHYQTIRDRAYKVYTIEI